MATWFQVILTGLAGAAVTVLAIGFLQGRETHRAKRAAKAAGRIIHLEITYNVTMLNEGRRLRPPQLYVTRAAWDAHSAQLAPILSEVEIAAVAAPYLRHHTWQQAFAYPTKWQIRPRFLGWDVQALDLLAERFRAAEQILRRKVWSGPRAQDVEDALALPARPGRASLVERSLNAIAFFRPSRTYRLIALAVIVALLMERLGAIERAISGLRKS
jgi:hypothetical protein